MSNNGNVVFESFQALNCHGKSLIELQLHELNSSTTPILSLLKHCTNLVSLSLSGTGDRLTDLDKSHSNGFLETVAWLKECKKLRTLACNMLFSAPALMTAIFSENSIQLTSLEYEGSIQWDNQKIHRAFHQALGNQTSLKKLWLNGDVVCDALDVDGLVESLSKLLNLTYLRLDEISTCFVDRHIVLLASSLPKLEVCLMCNGNGLTDAIWGEFATLRLLRRLEIDSLPSFTVDDILGFIEKLGPGNEGLVLSTTNADRENELFWDVWRQQDCIQEAIIKKVKGRFEFTLSEGD